jgi:hypothetical protein
MEEIIKNVKIETVLMNILRKIDNEVKKNMKKRQFWIDEGLKNTHRVG